MQRSRTQSAVLVLAGFGTLVAAYLTWIHFNSGSLVCGLGDCHTVQSSAYATIGPVPVAALGLGMYLLVLIANVLAARGVVAPELAWSVAFATLLAGLIYAIYLTWLEVVVIQAICQWCVVSALITALLALSQGILVWESVFHSPAGKGGETR